MQEQEQAAAVIVAAGSSRRMGGHDKIWTPLAGRVTLAHTIDVFEASPLISTIVLVLHSERIDDARNLYAQEGWQKVNGIIPGGERRQDSVCLGLEALAESAPDTRWVMIHDGARPLVTPEILEAGLGAACEHQAAIAAVPVKDTIKQAYDGLVHGTLARTQLWSAQTPQVFAFSLIFKAHHTEINNQEEATDDAALLERLGQPVAIFPGAYTNLKITTQEDLLIAEALLKGSPGL